MSEYRINDNFFFNEDCITGCQKHIKDETIDLIITDPPYGIDGDTLHKHYNRNEDFVVDGYVEVPAEEYGVFSHQWIKQAERVLKPGGSIYIVSGYTNLYHILDALKATSLQEINHIIWKYNFGVFTQTKFVSSHYHILFYEKPGKKKRTFNLTCRYGLEEKSEDNRSLNYKDREDVWIINREYKPGKVKNKNELPMELLKKMILYSSNEGDSVCDLFLGGFSTAKVTIGLGRRAIGFEISPKIFSQKIQEMKTIEPGNLLMTIRKPQSSELKNRGKKWSQKERTTLIKRYNQLCLRKKTKKDIIETLTHEFGRGRWSIEKVLKQHMKNFDVAASQKLTYYLKDEEREYDAKR